MAATEFIRVAARVRPAPTAQQVIVKVCDDKTLCFDPCFPKYLTFDSVFDEDVTQDRVFDDLGSHIVDGCVDGKNGTILVYGRTGSGKTHTMFGPPNVKDCLFDKHEQGIVPRVCGALFERLCIRAAEKGENFTYEVSCRFVELYNEELYDLLSSSQHKLSIRNDLEEFQLVDVSEHKVQSAGDFIRILETGWDARRSAETAMNRESWRSHSIFTVIVKTAEQVNDFVNKRSAILNLVDLAGFERQTQSKASGDLSKEAVNIDMSLTVLWRVVRTLSDVSRRDEYVPYCDSQLTHFLQDSLGGNSRTAVIVTIHPDKDYESDTFSTLAFAAECRKIENYVRPNEDLTGDTVMAYKSEIARLREEVRLTEERTRSELWSRMAAIKEELEEWKETAILREKALAEAQIRCDFLIAQLLSKANQESSDQQPHDVVMHDILTQLWGELDSGETVEEVPKFQLEDNVPKTCYNCGTTRNIGGGWKRVDGKTSCNACKLYRKYHTGEDRPEHLWRRPPQERAPRRGTRVEFASDNENTCYNCPATVPKSTSRRVEGKPACNVCKLYYDRNHCDRPAELIARERRRRRRRSATEQQEYLDVNVEDEEASGSSSSPLPPCLATPPCDDDDVELYCAKAEQIQSNAFKEEIDARRLIELMPSGLETVPCKQRRRCVECYKNLAADKGSQYARDHTKRTLTRCNRCKTHFCVNCYDPAHLCRPGELTTYCINAEEIHSNAFNEAVDVKYSRESTPPGLEKVPSKKRRRCVECYNDLSAVMGSYYARDHARKTHTRCVRCKTFFCVKCYDPGHRCGPRETT